MTKPPISLAELGARVKAQVAAQAAVKAAVKGGDTKAAGVARAAALEAEWVARAQVFQWETWLCECEESGTTPIGLFVLYENVRLANCSRLKAVPEGSTAHEALSQRWAHSLRRVSLCANCAPSRGFLTRWAPPPSKPLSPLAVPTDFRGEFTAEWERLTTPLPDEGALDEQVQP